MEKDCAITSEISFTIVKETPKISKSTYMYIDGPPTLKPGVDTTLKMKYSKAL